jgi:hypothetical protein
LAERKKQWEVARMNAPGRKFISKTHVLYDPQTKVPGRDKIRMIHKDGTQNTSTFPKQIQIVQKDRKGGWKTVEIVNTDSFEGTMPSQVYNPFGKSSGR